MIKLLINCNCIYADQNANVNVHVCMMGGEGGIQTLEVDLQIL